MRAALFAVSQKRSRVASWTVARFRLCCTFHAAFRTLVACRIMHVFRLSRLRQPFAVLTAPFCLRRLYSHTAPAEPLPCSAAELAEGFGAFYRRRPALAPIDGERRYISYGKSPSFRKLVPLLQNARALYGMADWALPCPHLHRDSSCDGRYSLYGTADRYWAGAAANIGLAAEHYRGWRVRHSAATGCTLCCTGLHCVAMGCTLRRSTTAAGACVRHSAAATLRAREASLRSRAWRLPIAHTSTRLSAKGIPRFPSRVSVVSLTVVRIDETAGRHAYIRAGPYAP
jgi:hypothetical protein